MESVLYGTGNCETGRRGPGSSRGQARNFHDCRTVGFESHRFAREFANPA
jgi:hypothetical protein